eukprot:Sspe_Gene.116877::Locus_107046_Transcript_1_1_Confidence_1.000_Length_779::g.116877::m.116877
MMGYGVHTRRSKEQVMKALSHAPQEARANVGLLISFFTTMRLDSCFLRRVLHRYMNAVKVVQRAARRDARARNRRINEVYEYLVQCSTADPVGYASAFEDSMPTTKEHYCIVLKLMHREARHEHQRKWKVWLSKLESATRRLYQAQAELEFLGLSPKLIAQSPRLTSCRIQVQTIKSEEPRFSFHVEPADFAAYYHSHSRKRLADAMTDIMRSLRIESNDPEFLTKLMDRYQQLHLLRKHRETMADGTSRGRSPSEAAQ